MITGLCYWWWLLWNVPSNIGIKFTFATLSTFELGFELIMIVLFSDSIINFFKGLRK